MKPTSVHIETGYDECGDFCLFATTPKHEYRMHVTLDNIDDVVAMLNNAIADIQAEERIMLAQTKESEE